MTDNVVKHVVAEANLISLDGNTLTFVYQVPATYELPEGTVNTNFYIAAIVTHSEQTSWVSGGDAFELKLSGKTDAGDESFPSSVYARLGERFGFLVQFSEPMQYGTGAPV